MKTNGAAATDRRRLLPNRDRKLACNAILASGFESGSEVRAAASVALPSQLVYAGKAMDIVLYPDPRLRRKNSPIEKFDAELAELARAMFEVMYRTKGVGLAAPQVGINAKLLVYNPEGDPSKSEAERVLANPKVVWKAKAKEFGEEGCLSFPNIFAPVQRPLAVKVEAQDLQGEPFTLELDGWDARIFQHELDHLDGILFTDRMTSSDKLLIKNQMADLEHRFKEQQRANT